LLILKPLAVFLSSLDAECHLPEICLGLDEMFQEFQLKECQIKLSSFSCFFSSFSLPVRIGLLLA